MPVYLDDIQDIDDNEYCGELLAVKEFNARNDSRKITIMNCLTHWQIFKNSVWQRQVYYAHILDHEYRTVAFNAKRRTSKVVLTNPHL